MPNMRTSRYVAARMDGKSARRSALEAGYSPATAKNAVRNVENRGAAITLVGAMRSAGISNDLLAQRLAEGLSATRDGEADFVTRFRYLQLAMGASISLGLEEDSAKCDLIQEAEKIRGLSDLQLAALIAQAGGPVPVLPILSTIDSAEISSSVSQSLDC